MMVLVVCLHKPDSYGVGRAAITWVREEIPVDMYIKGDI